MSIYKTAYETTACNGFNLHKIKTAIEAAVYDGSMGSIPESKINTVIGGSALANNVPSFAHPILVSAGNDNAEQMFIDARPYGKYDTDNREFKVRGEIEYSALVLRARLNYIWVFDNTNWLRDVSQAPVAVYASWISEAVAKRFALDPLEQFKLSILAAIFYNSQFSDSEELDERDKMRIVTSITRSIRASANDVIEIIDNVPTIRNVSEFCSLAESVTGSIRLKELNVGVLYTILGGTWFGTNAKETIAVALEHPPTWISILVASFTERSFKNSQISKLTERPSFKRVGEDFVRAILNLIEMNRKTYTK